MNRFFRYLVLIVFLFQIYFIIYSIVSSYEFGATGVGTIIVYIELMTIILYFFRHRIINQTSYIAFLPIFILIIIQQLHVLFSSNSTGTIDIISVFANPIFWAIPFLFFVNFFYFGVNNFEKKIIGFYLFSTVITVLYFFYQQQKYLIDIYSEINGIIDIYYVIALIPFILLLKNRVLVLIVLFFVGFAVALSFKLAGILAYGLALISYYSLSFKVIRKSFFKVFTKLLISIFLVSAVLFIINYYTDDIINSKIVQASDTEGSGRIIIWYKTLDLQFKSGPIEWLFGHLVDPRKDLKIETMAHNEFIEILFRYGLFALFVFIYLFYALIKFNIELHRNNSNFARSFSSAIIIFFVFSFFSHTITMKTGSVICLSLYFGYSIGSEKYILRKFK